jgi:hypothetical protein
MAITGDKLTLKWKTVVNVTLGSATARLAVWVCDTLPYDLVLGRPAMQKLGPITFDFLKHGVTLTDVPSKPCFSIQRHGNAMPVCLIRPVVVPPESRIRIQCESIGMPQKKGIVHVPQRPLSNIPEEFEAEEQEPEREDLVTNGMRKTQKQQHLVQIGADSEWKQQQRPVQNLMNSARMKPAIGRGKRARRMRSNFNGDSQSHINAFRSWNGLSPPYWYTDVSGKPCWRGYPVSHWNFEKSSNYRPP